MGGPRSRVVEGRSSVHLRGSGFDVFGGAHPKSRGVTLFVNDCGVARLLGSMHSPESLMMTPGNLALIVAGSRRLLLTDSAGAAGAVLHGGVGRCRPLERAGGPRRASSGRASDQ